MDLTPNVPPAPVKTVRSARHGRLFYLGLAGLGMGVFCCLLSVVALTLSASLNRKAAPTPTALPASLPTQTSLAENTPAPATQALAGSATTFVDDFSDSSSGWTVGSSDLYDASYSQTGYYVMGIGKANTYFVSRAPDNLPRPLMNVILTVRAEPIVGNTGDYGVVCRYQDMNNFYLAGIAGKNFYIGKQVNGKWIYLTSPGAQPLPDTSIDATGYMALSLSCIDKTLTFEVNGISAGQVTDDEFSTGEIGLCVWAGKTAGKGGSYARAAFDDFSARLP